MSGRVVSRFVLACDGCGTEREEAPTSIEARASAYADGWRYPAKVKANGDPAMADQSDLCPKCLPDWKPVPARKPKQYSVRRRE